MSSSSSTSIAMAVIVDSNNTVSYYPENSRTERSFKDALFAFTTSGSSKAAPMTVVSQSYDDNRYTHVAMHDDQNNFAGVCLSPSISNKNDNNDDDNDDDNKTDQYEQALLKDLVAIANISSLASGLDDGETFRSRVTRLFAERCSSSTDTAATMQGVEVLKRVLDKKKKTVNKNSKTTVTAPEKEKKPSVATYEQEDDKNKSKTSTVVVVDKDVHAEIVQEEERVDTACREQLKNASTRPMHHHHVSYHTEEFEKEWKQFQNTNQYKAGVGVLGISAIVATVMMLCSPTLASCTA